MNRKRKSSAGFTLLELMFVVLILTVVMGVVFQQILRVQKTSRTEEVKEDLVQESREFVDTFVRDVHQSGFPGAGMRSVALGTTSSQRAVGLVKFAYDEVWLEADVNGDGIIDTIDYKLTTDANGNCPCTIQRSQVNKVNGTAPDSQTISPTTELTGVINSGGANGGASGTAAYSLTGTTSTGASVNTVFAAYKTANVFTAYDASGNQISPATYSTGASTLATIKTIKINLNLLGSRNDLQTGTRPVITMSASARVGGN
jgi:prepilin-type N-terminal cleavage/methylation domain-containing protein